jgi:hypothetical protein
MRSHDYVARILLSKMHRDDLDGQIFIIRFEQCVLEHDVLMNGAVVKLQRPPLLYAMTFFIGNKQNKQHTSKHYACLR